MSTSAVTPRPSNPVVPMFDPSGQLRDVPYAQMNTARQAGATIGVRMQAPDGSIRYVPANRYVEATQNGGKVLPIKDQSVPQPGFWETVGSDLAGMAKGAATMAAAAFGDPAAREQVEEGIANQIHDAPAQYQQEKQEGYSLPYRVLAPVAQAAAVNVPGMEEAAREGNPRAVMGHAAAGATLAASPLLAEGAGAIADTDTAQAIARGAKNAAQSSVRAVGRAGGSSGLLGSAGAAIAMARGESPFEGYFLGEGLHRALKPAFDRMARVGLPETAPIERDATLNARNIPEYAGEEVPEESIAERDATRQNVPFAGEEQAEAPLPPQDKQAQSQAQSLGRMGTDPLQQARSLMQARQDVYDIVDKAVPPQGAGAAGNAQAKVQIDAALAKGDVDGAQAILDKAKQGDFPPPAPTPRPSVAEIRASIQGRSPTPDTLEDHALQQEMNWDLEKHGYRAESEARREFIARNSTGVTKGELIQAARTPTGAPDLTDLLQKSLQQIKRKKQ